MDPRGNAQVVRALVPLSEMFGYATDFAQHDSGSRDIFDAIRPLSTRPPGYRD